MHERILIAAVTLAMALGLTIGNARAFDESKYPNWKGQWVRGDAGGGRYDPSKPGGRGQQAPLKPEFQAMLEASLAEQAKGGQGNDPTYTCLSPGLPRIMNNYEGAEFVITPKTIHIFMEHIHDSRRIYTDGRDWPEFIEPSFNGYSTTIRACRCTRTMKASSRSGFSRTRTIRISCTSKRQRSTTR